MFCLFCGNQINDDAVFCGVCGKQIPRCPTCGAVIRRKVKFCAKDGTRLPDEVLALFSDEQSKTTQQSSENPIITPSQQAYYGDDTGLAQRSENMKSNTMTASGTDNEKPKKKKCVLPIIIALLVILLMAGAGIGAYIMTNGGFSAVFSAGNTEDSEDSEDSVAKENSDSEEESAAATEDGTDTENSAAGVTEAGIASEEESAVTESESMQTEEETEEEFEEEAEELTGATTPEEDALVYFIEHCDTAAFEEDYFTGFTAEQCRIARNGIYARSGRKFKDDVLTEYFESFDWYNPTIEPDDFTEDILNDYQIINRDAIVAYEAEMGY